MYVFPYQIRIMKLRKNYIAICDYTNVITTQNINILLKVSVRYSILGTSPPPVLLSSAAPERWSMLTSTARTPITYYIVYVLLKT